VLDDEALQDARTLSDLSQIVASAERAR